MHDHIISLGGKVWAHKTSLTPSRFIQVLVQNLEDKRINFGSFYDLIFNFGIVPTVLHSLSY